MLGNMHTFRSLLGTPILSKDYKMHDLVLFTYNETFLHIIPNGHIVLAQCAQIAAENNIQSLEIPLEAPNPLYEKALEAIYTACQTLGIDLPTLSLTAATASHPTEKNALFVPIVKATLPSLEQCRERLIAAITQGHQEIVDMLLQHPLVRQNTQLHTDALKAAAKANDIARVESLLANDSLLGIDNGWFSTIALEEAARNGHVELVKKLSQQTLPSKMQNSLRAAAIAGHLAVIQILLAFPELNEVVHIPLWKAAENGHIKIIQELLSLPEITHAEMLIALKSAARTGHLLIVQTLLSHLESQNPKSNNYKKYCIESIKVAIEKNHVAVAFELVSFMKEKKWDISPTLLPEAAKNGQLGIVRELLAIPTISAAAHIEDNLAFRYAAANGHLAIMHELLAYPKVKMNIATKHNEALVKAAENGHINVVRELLLYPEVKTQASIKNNLALCLAIQNGHLAVVRELITIPAVLSGIFPANLELFQRTLMGRLMVLVGHWLSPVPINSDIIEALAIAATNGYFEVVHELLSNPRIKAQIAANENTILRSAAKKHLGLVRELLAIPAVRNNASAQDNDALNNAAKNGRFDIMQELLTIPEVKAQVAANDNEVLFKAAQYGHLEIVRKLLTFPEVQAQIAASNNEALHMAAQNGHLKIVRAILAFSEIKTPALSLCKALQFAAGDGYLTMVQDLLTYPEVKALATANNNRALLNAVEHNHLEIVRELLMIPAINALVAINNNQILKAAIENGHIDMVRELLHYPVVCNAIDVNDNQLFRAAVRNGNPVIVKELLRYPNVLAKVASHHNAALRYAIDENHTDVINHLLTIPAVIDKLSFKQLCSLLQLPFIHIPSLDITLIIRKECLSKHELRHIINQIYCSPFDEFKILEALKAYLHYYGYPPIPADLTNDQCILAIENTIKGSFSDHFYTPQNHAGKILQTIANVNELKRQQQSLNELVENAESAMEESLVADAIKRFQDKIEPVFEKRFIEMGDIDGIEPKIIGLLLECKLAQLKQHPTTNSQATIDFIEHNKAALMLRQEDVLAKSRNYFTSPTDTVDIALRAFDRDAPTHGWEKLFVAPTKEKEASSVFSTRAASITALTLKQTTDITRKVLCYTYVVSQDESLSAEQKSTIQEALVHYLAEISRAHNDSDQKSDNPSCYPGTLTRLDLIFQKHPKFVVDKELFKSTADFASQLIIKAFNSALDLCKNKTEKLELYEAITLFSHDNARDILHRPDAVLTTEGESADLNKLLQIRKSFFTTYFGEQGNEGIKKINALLLNHRLFINEDLTEVALLPLLNMSRATPATTFSLTEAYQRAIPTEKPLAMSMVNPYQTPYQTIVDLFQHLPSPLKEKMAKARYIENGLKAVYFNYLKHNEQSEMEDLIEQTENAYHAARDTLFEKNSEINLHEWSFTEQMINALMRATGKAREQFPTERLIDEAIAKTEKRPDKRPRQDSHDNHSVNTENAVKKRCTLYDLATKEKRKREESTEIQNEDEKKPRPLTRARRT